MDLEDFETSSPVEKVVIPYKAFIHGLPVKGEELQILGTFVSPDGERLFLVINFPKLGILVSDDGAKTFQHTLIDSDYFVFQTYEDEESLRSRKSVRRDISVHPVFWEDRIAVSVGPFLFLSENGGRNWIRKTPFFNLDTSFIRKVITDEKGKLFVFTDSKVAYSDNWGKRWKQVKLKLDGKSRMSRFLFVDALFDEGSLYVSYLDKQEEEGKLFRDSYDYFYRGEAVSSNSGLYQVSGNLKKVTKLLDLPVLLLKKQQALYAFSPFHFGFRKMDLREEFRKTALFQTGELKNSKNSVGYLAGALSSEDVEKYFVPDVNKGKIWNVSERRLEKGSVLSEEMQEVFFAFSKSDIAYYFNGKGKDNKKDYDFYYFFHPLYLIRTFSGGYWNHTIFSCRKGDTVYRVTANDIYLKEMVKEILNDQYKKALSSSFFKKSSEEFDIDIKKVYRNFPFRVEKRTFGEDSLSNTWEPVVDERDLKRAIRPTEKMKSWYWHKNIDKKRQFKLEFILGSEEKIDMLFFPSDIMWYKEQLLLEISYFHKNNLYKELFRIEP